MIMKQNHKFKETEIGMIPEDWEVKPAESFCGRVTDGTHATPEKRDEGNYLITSRHLKEGHLDFDNAYFISTSDFNEINKRSKVDQWDIIFSMIGTVGEVYLEKSNKIEYAIKNVGLFKSGNELYGKWLFFFLKSRLANEYIRKNRSGTTQEYITLGSLRKFPIAYPRNTTEMQEIVLHLDSLQNKIELNQQMNATLEKIGQALFKHWFIDFEFPDEKGRPYKSSGGEMVDSELGKIPKGWGVVLLPKVATVVDCLHTKKPDKSLNSEGHFLLQVYNIALDGTLDLKEKYYVSDDDYKEWTKNIQVRKGDCLITNAGRVGAVAQIPYNFIGGIGRNITAIRPIEVGPTYLFRYLLSHYGLKEIDRQTDHGTVLNSLNVKGIKKIRVLYPLPNVMHMFEECARSLRSKVEINNVENELLAQIRDSLLPRLMSGRIRVNAEVAR